jgi:hypothetical protein
MGVQPTGAACFAKTPPRREFHPSKFISGLPMLNRRNAFTTTQKGWLQFGFRKHLTVALEATDRNGRGIPAMRRRVHEKTFTVPELLCVDLGWRIFMRGTRRY